MISRGKIVSIKGGFDLTKEDDVLALNKARSARRNRTATSSQIGELNAYSNHQKLYQVRMPLIHGEGGDNSSIPDSQLPWATYCPIPGSAYSELHVGDVVYVAIVDFQFDDIVILGCVPNMTNSNSGVALERVTYLQMADGAPLHIDSNVTIGSGKEQLTFKNLSALCGFEEKLSDITWSTERGGTGVSVKPGGLDKQNQKKVRDNFGIPTTEIISQSKFERLVESNGLEHGTIYYIWDDGQRDYTK